MAYASHSKHSEFSLSFPTISPNTTMTFATAHLPIPSKMLWNNITNIFIKWAEKAILTLGIRDCWTSHLVLSHQYSTLNVYYADVFNFSQLQLTTSLLQIYHQLEAPTVFHLNWSSRSHFEVTLKTTLIILYPGTKSSWPENPFYYTTRTHISEITNDGYKFLSFLTKFYIGKLHFTSGASAFGLYCRPTLQGSHLMHYLLIQLSDKLLLVDMLRCTSIIRCNSIP